MGFFINKNRKLLLRKYVVQNLAFYLGKETVKGSGYERLLFCHPLDFLN